MLKSTDVVNEVRLAESRIRSHIRQTILEHSLYLSQVGGANVYCKLENLQYTGSFKVRGAMNKLLSVMSEELAQGVVTTSTGNHGVAVAIASYLKMREHFAGKTIVIIICGANISLETLKSIL